MGIGGLSSVHRVPFHCSTIPGPVTVGPLPTATQFVDDSHAMPFKPVPFESGLGLATIDHLAPSQRSTSVLLADDDVEELPTAKQLVVVGHDTSASELPDALAALGLATIDHVAPFQCSISVFVIWVGENASTEPTAKHDVTPRHETELSVGWLLLVRSGLATIDHAVPFQRSISGCE